MPLKSPDLFPSQRVGSGNETNLSPDVVDHFDLAIVVKIELFRYLIEVKVVGGLHVLESNMKVSRGALAEETVGGA